MPSDRACPGADINYRYSYDEICHEAYLKEIEEQRRRRKK